MITIDTSNTTTLQALSLWGTEAQKAILMEENAECISAMARHSRGRTDTEPVAEEIADVIVSMQSVIPALGIEKEVKRYIKIKLKRLEGRVNENNR